MATSVINTEKSTSVINTEKWKTGIDATVTNIKKVKAFINWRLSTYKKKGWKGFNLQESFINNFKLFIKDTLNNLSKDQLKEIKDYLCKNSIYIQKEARKLITDSLLGIIYELTPLKWPTNNFASNPTNDFTNNPINNSTDDFTDDFTLALLLPSTAPV